MKMLKKAINALTARSVGYVNIALTMVSALYDNVTGDAAAMVQTEAQLAARYVELQATFNDELRKRWRNYIKTVQLAWFGVLGLMLWSLLVGSWLTLLESVCLFVFVWVFLGYRIWIIREKKFPMLHQYLKIVPRSLLSAVPFGAANLMD